MSGNYAYVADGPSGLQIINISNPASPTLVGTYNTTDEATNVAVSGNYAYVADNSSGLQIINISTPASSTLVGTYNTPGAGRGVAVSGNYAYVADNSSGLQIINISNPASPTLVGTYNTTGEATNVAVSGNYAYVADFSSGLQIINISTPASPTLVGTYVVVSGNTAYLADYYSVQVIDISNPASPTLVSAIATNSPRDVVLSGGYVYSAASSSGLRVISQGSNAVSSTSDTVSISVVANTAPSATEVNLPYTDTSAANTFTDATGTLTFTDTESNSFTLSLSGSSAVPLTENSVTYDVSKTSPYGTLFFESSTGKYLFRPDAAAINKLTSSTSVEFAVSATDNGVPAATGQTTIKVNLTGANDTPVLVTPTAIGIVDTAEADTEAGLIKGSSNNTGTLSATDAENGALTYGITGGTTGGSTLVNGVTYDVQKAGTNGTLYVNSSTGGYVFVPTASAVNALTAGSTSETFTVTASDGSASGSQTLTVNYTGVNDTPVITSTNPPAALFFADTSASNETFANQTGTLAGSDADTGQTKTFGITGGIAYSGANLTGVGAGSYDVQKADATYGTLYLNSATGAYTFVPVSTAIDALGGHDTINLSFDLTVGDGTTSVSTALEVKISGKDDEPVVAKEAIKLLDTAAADTFTNQTGSIDAFDVDSGGAENRFNLIYGFSGGTAGGSLSDGIEYDISRVGTYGKLYLVSTGDNKGKYVYVPTATAINALSANTTDTFTISASDGATPTPGIGTNTFTVNINAVNDAPVLAAPTAISLTDTAVTDSFANQTGTLSATNAENTTQTLSYTLAGATSGSFGIMSDNLTVTYNLQLVGKYGTLYVVSSDEDAGKYVYVPDAAKINALTGNAVDSFGVGASDGTLTDSSVLAVNVTGANDTPVLATVTALSYTDTTGNDIFQTQGGQLGGSDADSNAALTYGIDTGTTGGTTNIGGVVYDVSKAGTYGTLYVASSSGAYLYVPDTAKMESLKSGAGSDSFTISLTDGVIGTPVTQTLTVNLAGADDPNEVSGASTGQITEDATSLTTTGQLLITDRDTVDATITTQTNTAGTYGSFSVAADGRWSYTLNNAAPAVQALAFGTSVTDSFAVVANGASTNVVLTVSGANDVPVITSNGGGATAAVSVAENATAVTTVSTTDADTGDTLTYSISGGADAAKFNIVAATGVLTFATEPMSATRLATTPTWSKCKPATAARSLIPRPSR